MKHSLFVVAIGASFMAFTACQDKALSPTSSSSSPGTSSVSDSTQASSSLHGSSSSINKGVRDSDSVVVHSSNSLDTIRVISSSSIHDTVYVSSSSALSSSSSGGVSRVDSLQIIHPDGTISKQSFSGFDTVFVSQGSAIGLTLLTNSSTGYTWEESVIPNMGSVVMDSSILCPAQTSTYDSSGTYVPIFSGVSCRETFRFTFNQPGSYDVSLNYVRPWDKTANPINLSIAVIVQ